MPILVHPWEVRAYTWNRNDLETYFGTPETRRAAAPLNLEDPRFSRVRRDVQLGDYAFSITDMFMIGVRGPRPTVLSITFDKKYKKPREFWVGFGRGMGYSPFYSLPHSRKTPFLRLLKRSRACS